MSHEAELILKDEAAFAIVEIPGREKIVQVYVESLYLVDDGDRGIDRSEDFPGLGSAILKMAPEQIWILL